MKARIYTESNAKEDQKLYKAHSVARKSGRYFAIVEASEGRKEASCRFIGTFLSHVLPLTSCWGYPIGALELSSVYKPLLGEGDKILWHSSAALLKNLVAWLGGAVLEAAQVSSQLLQAHPGSPSPPTPKPLLMIKWLKHECNSVFRIRHKDQGSGSESMLNS